MCVDSISVKLKYLYQIPPTIQKKNRTHQHPAQMEKREREHSIHTIHIYLVFLRLVLSYNFSKKSLCVGHLYPFHHSRICITLFLTELYRTNTLSYQYYRFYSHVRTTYAGTCTNTLHIFHTNVQTFCEYSCVTNLKHVSQTDFELFCVPLSTDQVAE